MSQCSFLSSSLSPSLSLLHSHPFTACPLSSNIVLPVLCILSYLFIIYLFVYHNLPRSNLSCIDTGCKQAFFFFCLWLFCDKASCLHVSLDWLGTLDSPAFKCWDYGCVPRTWLNFYASELSHWNQRPGGKFMYCENGQCINPCFKRGKVTRCQSEGDRKSTPSLLKPGWM